MASSPTHLFGFHCPAAGAAKAGDKKAEVAKPAEKPVQAPKAVPEKKQEPAKPSPAPKQSPSPRPAAEKKPAAEAKPANKGGRALLGEAQAAARLIVQLKASLGTGNAAVNYQSVEERDALAMYKQLMRNQSLLL